MHIADSYIPQNTDAQPIPYPQHMDRVYYRGATYTDLVGFTTVGNLAGLRYFYFYSNTVPVGSSVGAFRPLGSCPDLVYIYLRSNTNLGGAMPANWSTLGQLQRLYIDRTDIAPVVPPAWSGLGSLRYVYARNMGWTTADVDQFLSQFAAAVAGGMGSVYGSNKRLYINNSGTFNPNAAPTGGSINPDVLALQAAGWAVYPA